LGIWERNSVKEKWRLKRLDSDGQWMKQIARNLTDPVAGFLRDAKHLIHDRDPLFTEAFEAILQPQGIECVKIPAQSPNCNAYAERFVKSIRYECMNHFVFFGERHLRHVIKEYMAHYHFERFHQGLGGQLITGNACPEDDNSTVGKVHCSWCKTAVSTCTPRPTQEPSMTTAAHAFCATSCARRLRRTASPSCLTTGSG